VKIFFTSDRHFFHKSRAQARGFGEDVDAMNTALVNAHNSVVGPKDICYDLGDLSFGNPFMTASMVLRLNGTIRLVPGNHDLHRKGENLAELQRLLAPSGKLEVQPRLLSLHLYEQDVRQMGRGLGPPIQREVRLELCHFPMLVWDRAHFGTLHLHGHSHGNCRYPDNNARLDVGVDALGLVPIALDQVIDLLKAKGYTAHDHHEPQLS
jgi:calcineurin-like phosphoesterase family protein